VVGENSEVAPSPPRRSVAERTKAPQEGPFYRDMELLYRDHKSKLEQSAKIWGASPAEASDLVSSVFLEMLKRPTGIDDPVPYAYRALRNAVWAAKKRSQWRLQRRMVEMSQYRPDTADDSAMSEAEYRDYLESLKKLLTPRQREVLELSLKDLSTKEIAEHLGNSPEAVRQHMRQIRQRLVGPIRRDQGFSGGEPREEMT
jgi:RNA polymerase sigma factor (sigma-70 family)